MISNKIKSSLRNAFFLFTCFLSGCASDSSLSCDDQADVKEPESTVLDVKETKSVVPENTFEPQVFDPTFVPEKDPYSYAYSIYNSSKFKPTGVYEKYGVVFVIVNIDLKKEKLKYVKGTAMLRAKVLLKRRYDLPSQFNLTCRELEARNYRNLGVYRYALAYRESDVIKLSKQTQGSE